IYLRGQNISNSSGTLFETAFRDANLTPHQFPLNKNDVKVPSHWLQANPVLLKQFCVNSITRILLGDMNVGPGNYQVVGSGDNKRLIASNFNASMMNLAADINVFDKKILNSEGKMLSTNGLYEYSSKVRTSVEMAEAMIEVGHIDRESIRSAVREMMSQQN